MPEVEPTWTWINKRNGLRWTTGMSPLTDAQIIAAVEAEHGDEIDCIAMGMRDKYKLVVENGKIIVTGACQPSRRK
jgi:hypothetical protein